MRTLKFSIVSTSHGYRGAVSLNGVYVAQCLTLRTDRNAAAFDAVALMWSVKG